MTRSGGTLMEVARRCAVSQSTVSRVLNNYHQGRFSVSDELRRRILQAARDLNYRPSMAARNLATSKTNLVAVVGVAGISSDSVGPVEEAVSAMASVLDRSGYEICVQFLSQRHGRCALPPLRVDGVVALGATGPADLQPLEEAQIPYVSLNGAVGPHGSLAAPDDARGTRLALRHLVDLGHRCIAYLDHHWLSGAEHPSVAERRQAFTAAATELGFTAPDPGLPLLLASESPWDCYYEPFLRRAIIEGGATAVLAYSHQAAIAIMRTAHDAGLSVPRDFSLVCFNDEPVVRLSVPSITAVDVPSVRMGQVAAELLLRQMASATPLPPQYIKLDESLIVRESTVPPHGRARD